MSPRFLWLSLVLGMLVWSTIGQVVQVQATGEHSFEGRAVNGTSDKAGPPGLSVVLHIIDSQDSVKTLTTETDQEGYFLFPELAVDGNASYVINVTYEGVVYTSRLEAEEAIGTVDVTVYDTTPDIEQIGMDANVLLISGTNEENSTLSALELVSLTNEGKRTFIPNLVGGGSMNFLRFSLPSGFTNLEVQSSLPSGQLLTTELGFAMTAPVPPGTHEIALTYRIPYSQGRLEFSRSFPIGAEIFRLLLPEDLGYVINDGLQEVEAAVLPGGTYRAWSAGPVTAGSRLGVTIEGLPRSGLPKRVWQSLTDGLYLKIGIPTAMGVVLVSILAYSLLKRQPSAANAIVRRASVSGTQGAERRALVEDIAKLDDLFEKGGIEEQTYTVRRAELRQRFLQLEGGHNSTSSPRER